MDRFHFDTNFSRCHSNPDVYTKKVGNHFMILVIYVYEIILISSDPKILIHVKSNLNNTFEMTNLGNLYYFLGPQFFQTMEGIYLSQSKYACDLLHHFHMEDCNPTPSPFQFGVKLIVTYTILEVDDTL
jgi:hypothetical protein